MASVAQKLFSGSALRVLNLGAGALVGLALLPLMVYSLGDRMYGLWALVGTLIGYYGVMDFGLSTAVTRHLAGAVGARDEREFSRVFNTALLLYSGVAVVTLAVTVVLAAAAGRLAAPKEMTAEGISERITALLADAEAMRARLQARVPEVRENAFRAGSLLRDLLANRATEPAAGARAGLA